MYVTKELDLQTLTGVIAKSGMIERRPDLARLIMSGQTSFSDGDTSYALKGSEAAHREHRVQSAELIVKKDAPTNESNLDRLAREIREESAPTPAAEPEPTRSKLASVLAPRPETPTAPTKAARLVYESPRLKAHRSDQRAREGARVVGKIPSKMAKMLEGGNDPRGAA